MSIEYVKPPATAKKDKKLAILGSGLVIVGLLGTAQVSVIANGVATGATGINLSGTSTVIWEGTWAYPNSDFSNSFNAFAICTETAVTCDADRALQVFWPNQENNAVSTTLYSTFTYDNGTKELGPNKFQIQLILNTPTERITVGNPVIVGPLGPCCNNPAPGPGPQNNPVRESVAFVPPVSIDMQVSLPATALFAGNREFRLEASNMAEVREMTINGRPLPIVSRNKNSIKIRVPFLRPGSYNVTVSTETDSWVIPNAITIGELPANVKSEGLDESFPKFSSELPRQTKQEIRSLIEQTPDLRSVTVFAIAKREIIGEDRNKLARSRAASAFEFIRDIDPTVKIKTEIIHYTEVELTSRGLFFRVAQKKQP